MGCQYGPWFQAPRSVLLLIEQASSMLVDTCPGYSLTCFASMHVFWYVIRWLIPPSREMYEAMPQQLRPV